ncbi:MAG: PAS domain-containing protein [Anaerolineales bacterium]|nr:PAS domain-containing protein [Anaerolineales bacterium]
MKKNTMASPRGETESEQLAGILRSLVAGTMLMSLVFVIVSLTAFNELILRSVVICAVVSIVSSFVLGLIDEGRVGAAGWILFVLTWAAISIGAYISGGVDAPIMVGYVVVILAASLLFGFLAGALFAFLSIVFGGFLIYAEWTQLLPDSFEYSPAAKLLIYSFFFLVVALFQRMSVNLTRRAFARADESETRYRYFLENISTVTYIEDVTILANMIYVSPQVEKMLGYTQEEFLANPLLWLDIVVPEDREAVKQESIRTSKTGETFTMEYRLFSKDTKLVWVRDEARLIRNAKGDPEYWLGVWADITQAKQAEVEQDRIVESLTRRTVQLQTASEVSRAATSILELGTLLSTVVELIRSHFDYYYVGIFLADENNERAVLRAATGEMGQVLLKSQHSLPIGNSSMIGWCIANNEARIVLDVGEDAVRFKNPLLPLTRSELALPLRARGDVIGAMSIQSTLPSAFSEGDITALQTMADQVGNAIETARLFDDRSRLIKELETKNAELERFSYTVSHDLKSPLVTIRGFVGYLREDARKGDMERFDSDLARVVNATDKMQNLLGDLLQLSRIGRVINPMEDVDFDTIVTETLHLALNPLMMEEIKVEVQEDLPKIRCDRVRVVEVLQNLVTNAVKFMGEQREPVIQIGSYGLDEKTGFPILFVKDNGMGIDPQYHERVFGLFNRLSPEGEGTGIGLAIVKRIVEVHGGRIWLSSEGNNKGSTFFFTLPAAES